MKKIILPIIPLVVVTLVAEILSRRGVLPPFLFPAPTSIFTAVADDPATFAQAFFQTTLASAAGLGISMILGLGFAMLLAYSRIIREMFYPYAIFFQTVPIIAIAPLLVIWLGYGLPTVVASSFIVSIFPVIANSVLGLLNTDPLLLSLFHMIGAQPSQVLFRLRLPYALPQILGGFKIAAGLSVIGAIVGEFISGGGLGGLVDTARNQQRIDRVFASVILAAALGGLFFFFISLLNRLFLRHWRETNETP